MSDNSDLGRKILVAGQGGKSTLARALAAELDLPYIEMDAIYWLPNWVERDRAGIDLEVQKVLDRHPDGWVIDGNYGTKREGRIAEQVETVIYLNISWSLLIWRVFWRSVVRARDKKLICGENVETWRRTFFSRRSHLWFLIRHRNELQARHPRIVGEWLGDDRMIELVGRKELGRFYSERGLVRD
jgi:adenylate kinase family enzyme